jgi:hypothetical protein
MYSKLIFSLLYMVLKRGRTGEFHIKRYPSQQFRISHPFNNTPLDNTITGDKNAVLHNKN